eukprot:1347058-Ditylum_brightwellii.AAC.1
MSESHQLKSRVMALLERKEQALMEERSSGFAGNSALCNLWQVACCCWHPAVKERQLCNELLPPDMLMGCQYAHGQWPHL